MNEPEEFDAEIVAAEGGKVRLVVPFNPSDKWGKQARHRVTCRIGKQEFEGSIGSRGGVFFIPLNKEVRAQLGLEVDTKVRVVLRPQGGGDGAVESGVASELPVELERALSSAPKARAFLDSLSSFYRNEYIKWVGSAKKSETRSSRAAAAVELLAAGKKQR